MMLECQEGIRKVTEELLQQAGDAVDIVIKVLGVPKVESRAGGLCFIVSSVLTSQSTRHTCVKHVLELLDVSHGARLSVDAFHVESIQINCLNALVNHHRNR